MKQFPVSIILAKALCSWQCIVLPCIVHKAALFPFPSLHFTSLARVRHLRVSYLRTIFFDNINRILDFTQEDSSWGYHFAFFLNLVPKVFPIPKCCSAVLDSGFSIIAPHVPISRCSITTWSPFTIQLHRRAYNKLLNYHS